ncbi:MAG: hypothetical protein KC619_17520, partial [Myxococcales bacterium]|nr:hypothetical protein [Myxococcales bacterium]
MSTYLGVLRREIDDLRKELLPDPFDPLGNYADPSVRTRTRGFLLLAHASVETFLEEWARDIAKKAEKVWNTDGRITRPLAFLLCTMTEQMAVARDVSGSDTSDKMKDAVASAGCRSRPE